MTIKEIEKQVEATKEAREQLIKTKDENEKKAKEYREKADSAAISGDLVQYKELKSLAEDAEAVAYVCGKQLEVEHPVTLEQTRDAWDSYAADYNKKLSAKLRKLEAAKADLLKDYADALIIQGEACAVRERLARYAGVHLQPTGVGIDDNLEKTYPMEYIPCKNAMKGDVTTAIAGSSVKDPDAVYYLASLQLDMLTLAKDPRQHAMVSVVCNHRAV